MAAKIIWTRLQNLIGAVRRAALRRVAGQGKKGVWVGHDFNLFLTDPEERDRQ